MSASSADAEAWTLLEAATGSPKLDLIVSPGIEWTREAQRRVDGWVEARRRGVPIQHLVGTAHFYGIELRSTPSALIPRLETERLVELALADVADIQHPVVIDVGTGSGAIAIAVACERPTAEVWACDVDPEALHLARENVAVHAPRVHLVESDLLTAPMLAPVLARADLVVANLPYLPEADAALVPLDVQHDPPAALYSGRDGLDLFRRLVDDLRDRLPTRATAWFELDPRNVDEGASWCGLERTRHGRTSTVHEDLVGRRRFLQWASGCGS